MLNLIDTPGHVDFSYEVSRSLASCEGVLLLIDAAQFRPAYWPTFICHGTQPEIIPVINKLICHPPTLSGFWKKSNLNWDWIRIPISNAPPRKARESRKF